MDHWNYSRASQQQGHSQSGQLGYPPGSFGSQQGAASMVTPYASQILSQPSFGQAYSQQILGVAGKSAGSEGPAIVSGMLNSGSMSGIYGFDSKFPSAGFDTVGAAPGALNQKTDQLSALGQYSKLASDGHNDTLKRYSESQLLQTALRQGAALDSGFRSQSDYLSAGRSSAITGAAGGAYVSGRDLLGSSYGIGRSEAEAALLGSQVGLSGRGGVGVLPFQSQAVDSLGSLAGARSLLGAMYPPSAPYSSLDITSARSGISGMSDLAGIGSTRYDDRLDDRIGLRYEYDRRDDDRRIRERSRERDLDRERERDRERSWEREREREWERLRERERIRDRERLRDRERAREREREKEQRRRERTPPRIVQPLRREEKALRKVSPPPARFSSPPKPRKREYMCKVEPFCLVDRERDLLSVIRRYPRLFVSPDFSKVVSCWKDEGLEIAVNQPVSFELDAVDAEEEYDAKDAVVTSTEDAEASKESTVWSVKVMLMSGLSDDSVKELLTDSANEEKPVHMHNFVRFVVFRKERSALMAVGGAWDKLLDGGDPAADESALIRTASRCVKDATQLDLDGASSWRRIMEVHYDRLRENNSPYKEITVFFIPDLSGCLPPLESWKLQWKQQREARSKQEASIKQEKDVKSGGSPKGSQKKDKAEKQLDRDKEEEKFSKKEEKVGKEVKKDEKKEKDTKEDKKDIKKEEKKEREIKKEEKKEKDSKKDERKDKDTKKEDKKENDSKHVEKKEKDLKKEDRKAKDRKSKEEKKDKEQRKDEEKKEEKKTEKDVKATKSKGTDKKGKMSLELEAPEVPGFFLTNRTKAGKARVMTISLDGLLDYDERDKEESTFELSLFAEVFQEMLQYRYGLHILEAFEFLHRCYLGRKKEDRKRGRHDKAGKTTSKKSKFSDSSTPVCNVEDETDKISNDHAEHATEEEKKDDPKPLKDIDAAMQEASLINFDELEEELQETPEMDTGAPENDTTKNVSEAKKSTKTVLVDEKLLKAFRYFDRNRLNYLKAEDVRRLLHILGRCLTRRWVKDLSTTASTETRSKDDCIYYKKLVEKEIL